MKFCSASSASASLAVATKSIVSTRASISSAPRAERPLKCEATRLRIDFALPDVERAPVGVLEQVDAGGVGQRPALVAQPLVAPVVGCAGHTL